MSLSDWIRGGRRSLCEWDSQHSDESLRDWLERSRQQHGMDEHEQAMADRIDRTWRQATDALRDNQPNCDSRGRFIRRDRDGG